MKAEAWRLLAASFGFALYLGVPVQGVLLPTADAAIVSSPAGAPGKTAMEEGDDQSGSDDSGSDDSSGDEDEGSSEDDSD